MFRKLDTYIFKNNLALFISGNLGILCLFIFIDLFDKYFDGSKLKVFDGAFSIFLFYLYDTSSLIELFSPFCLSLCSVMTISKLQQTSQMVAIHSSGISIYRVFSNFILSSIILCILLFISQNYITPQFLIKKSIITDKDLLSKPIENIHFKDRIYFKNRHPEIANLKSGTYASINIEDILLSKSHAMKFHATIFNEGGAPIAKLFGNKLKWNDKNNINIENGFFFSYFGDNNHKNFKNLKISLNTNIYHAYLAQNNPSCLSLQELSKFKENKEVESHYWFRYFYAVQPIVMLLFAFAFVIPILYRSPVTAYFLTLSCCIFIFLMYKYLKNEMQSNDLSPVMISVILLSVCIFPLYFNKKNIPT